MSDADEEAQPSEGYDPGFAAPKTYGLAIAAIVLSIGALVLPIGPAFLCGLLGFIFGVVSLNAINKSNGALKGRGLAITGIVLGPIDIALSIIAYNVIVD